MEGRVRDISKSGFAMVFEQQLKRGINYEFVINRRVDPILIRGHVVHIQNEKAYFIIGVRIDSLSLAQRSRFNRFLSQHSPELKQHTVLYAFLGALAVATIFHFVFGTTAVTALLIFMVAAIFLKIFMPF